MVDLTLAIEDIDTQTVRLRELIDGIHHRDLDSQLESIPDIFAELERLHDQARSFENAANTLDSYFFLETAKGFTRRAKIIRDEYIPQTEERLKKVKTNVAAQQARIRDYEEQINTLVQAKTKLLNANV